jgi:long-chain acyl-CoA synthetase
MVAVVDRMPHVVEPGDVALLYLPLAHNFGRLIHLTGPFAGVTVAVEPDPNSAAAAIQAVRPMVFPSVPRAYEKMHTAVVAAFDDATGLRCRLIDWALDVGRRVGRLRAAGEPVPRGLALQHRLADRIVYAKVKARLGGRLRIPISGGAPLSKEIAEFFDAVDIRILEAYGLTECTSGATGNRVDAYRYGTVGQALPGVELRLADDGELLIRSPMVFAGYHRDPEATAEVLDGDGWLRSGDIASIDEEGFVTITDRKKDIIVTAGGKNIAPQNIENDLKTSRFVSQALVVGDRRPYPTALITLDADEIGKWAGDQGIDGGLDVLASDKRVRELIAGVVDDVNRERTRFEQIKRFAILPRDFEAEREEVTPTLKLRRRTCIEHFAETVESLYAGADGDRAPASELDT